MTFDDNYPIFPASQLVSQHQIYIYISALLIGWKVCMSNELNIRPLSFHLDQISVLDPWWFPCRSLASQSSFTEKLMEVMAIDIALCDITALQQHLFVKYDCNKDSIVNKILISIK